MLQGIQHFFEKALSFYFTLVSRCFHPDLLAILLAIGCVAFSIFNLSKKSQNQREQTDHRQPSRKKKDERLLWDISLLKIRRVDAICGDYERARQIDHPAGILRRGLAASDFEAGANVEHEASQHHRRVQQDEHSPARFWALGTGAKGLANGTPSASSA
jgi:hypothetical protein